MWQFAESIRGMRDACLAFDTPVTGGNVSFYNESGDSAIWPTPVIGMLGLLADHRLRVPSGVRTRRPLDLPPGRDVPRAGWVGVRRGGPGRGGRSATGAGSGTGAGAARAAARGGRCRPAGRCPRLRRRRVGVTLAEQAILGGHGFAVTIPGDLPPHVALFSESASRAIVAVAPERVDALADLPPPTASRSRRSGRRAARVWCSTGCSRPPSTSSATSTRARSRGCSARSRDRGRHVRLLGDARLRRRGHRCRGGRLDALASAPQVVGDPS